MLKLTDRQWAYFTLRLTFGVSLFMHGLTRIHLSGIGGSAGEGGFGVFFLALLMYGFLVVLPIAGLFIGALIVLGLFTRYALIAGAFLITATIFATAAGRHIFGPADHLQLIHAIAFFILLFTLEYNRLCIDRKRS